jgi:uncharacterized membrane-anchored protein
MIVCICCESKAYTRQRQRKRKKLINAIRVRHDKITESNKKALQEEKNTKRAKETADRKALQEEKKTKRAKETADRKALQEEKKTKRAKETEAQKLKESVRVNSICVSCQCISLYFCYNLTFIC